MSTKKWFGLVSLFALAAAVGIGVSTRDAEAAAGVNWDNNAALQSINTDARGVIIDIGYKAMNAPRSVNGCGAKIQDLPHLLEHYKIGRTVDLKIEAGCFKGLRARK